LEIKFFEKKKGLTISCKPFLSWLYLIYGCKRIRLFYTLFGMEKRWKNCAAFINSNMENCFQDSKSLVFSGYPPEKF